MQQTGPQAQNWLVLGATGKLGQPLVGELAHRHGSQSVVGAARHPPKITGLLGHFLEVDAEDGLRLAELLPRCHAVLHLCAHDRPRAQALIAAAAQVGHWPTLVVASSIAERRPQDWLLSEDQVTSPPQDAFGLTLREANDQLLAGWQGPLHIALLPQLFAAGDPRDRLAMWLAEADHGALGLPGTGQQHPALIDVLDASRLLADLAELPRGVGRVVLGHPQPQTAMAIAQAALAGSGQSQVPIALGGAGRALSGGDERLNLGKQQRLWPDYPWQPLLQQVRTAAATWQIARNQ